MRACVRATYRAPAARRRRPEIGRPPWGFYMPSGWQSCHNKQASNQITRASVLRTPFDNLLLLTHNQCWITTCPTLLPLPILRRRIQPLILPGMLAYQYQHHFIVSGTRGGF